MTKERLYESTRYDFTPSELKKLGEDLAREALGVYELEQKKKELTSELSAELKSANGRVASLAKKLNAGHEYRDVECELLLDTPRPGMKCIIDSHTGAVIREEPMTGADFQQRLALDEE